MTASMIIVFGLASILFLTMVLLGAALFMRNQWDALADSTSKTKRHQTTNSARAPSRE